MGADFVGIFLTWHWIMFTMLEGLVPWISCSKDCCGKSLFCHLKKKRLDKNKNTFSQILNLFIFTNLSLFSSTTTICAPPKHKAVQLSVTCCVLCAYCSIIPTTVHYTVVQQYSHTACNTTDGRLRLSAEITQSHDPRGTHPPLASPQIKTYLSQFGWRFRRLPSLRRQRL